MPLHQRGGFAPWRLFAEGSLTCGRLITVAWGPRKDVASIGGIRDFAQLPGLRGVGRYPLDPQWERRGERLYEAAAEVAAALAR